LVIDGKFWLKNSTYKSWKTWEAVLNFQKDYNEKQTDPDKKLSEDWIPGLNTIAALLDNTPVAPAATAPEESDDDGEEE
jgi:hypothetical protein